LILNEFILQQNLDFTVTASAFSQARNKLKHTAFVELNNDLINSYYKPDEIKHIKGFRLVAFDGSKLTLPNTQEIKDEFGTMGVGNHTGVKLEDYSSATFEAGYDVLNNICLTSKLVRGDVSEINIAIDMLQALQPNDLAIFDRGYTSYPMLANLYYHKKQFIIRCSNASFKEARKMFEEKPGTSKIVEIPVPSKHAKNIRLSGLPDRVKVRFVTILLSTGELEVLMTSFLDENQFNADDFKYLYGLRWGVETFFRKLKSRLTLDNFTGKSVESIYQDLFSTVYISNLETVLTEDIEQELNISSSNVSPRVKINKAVSFNAIKNMAFDLLYDESHLDSIIENLTILFTRNTVLQRPDRKVIRSKTTETRSLNFQRRKRKHVF
jgi:hypothetical protein